MSDQHMPPATAEFVAAVIMPDESLREAFLGDLAEEYDRVASRRSVRAANRWYWSQLARSTVPLSLMAISNDGPRGALRLLVSVLGGYALMMLLVTASVTGVIWSFALAHHTEYVVGALAFGDRPWIVAMWSVVTLVITGVASGYVAVLVGRRSATVSVLTLGVAGILFVVSESGDAPLWFQIALTAILLGSVLSGGLLRSRNAMIYVLGLVVCAAPANGQTPDERSARLVNAMASELRASA
ncbi:MAG: hypothetical protein ABI969_17910, partial [bacterium]